MNAGRQALRSYLTRNNLSITRFCAQSGIDRIATQHVLNGKRKRISVDYAKAVSDATHGEVPMPLWASASPSFAA